MKRNLLSALVLLSALLSVNIGLHGAAKAQTESETAKGVAEHCTSSFLGLPAWFQYLDVQDVTDENGVVNECEIVGPLKNDGSGELDTAAVAYRVSLAVVEILLRIAGLVAVVFVIYGGFRYITSQGDPESTKNARRTIVNALIGLVIAVIASVLVAFLGNYLTKPLA